MSDPVLWCAVAILGGCGAVLRAVVDEAIRRRAAGSFPVGILVVNVSGAFVLGALTGAGLSRDASLLAGTAFVGAYTTFSTWMLDLLNAATARMWLVAAGNLFGSLALGLLAAALGRQLGLSL